MISNMNDGEPVEPAPFTAEETPIPTASGNGKALKPYYNRESRTALAKKRSALNKPAIPVSEELEGKWGQIYDSTVPLARLLRERREELGLKQADVARALDIKSSEFIGMVENGQRKLDLNRIPELAGVLKLNTESLCRLALFEAAPQFALSIFGAKIKTFVPVPARGRRVEAVEMSPEQVAIYQRLYALPSPLRLTILGLIEQFSTLIRKGASRVRVVRGSK